jgi:hypothetical protein
MKIESVLRIGDSVVKEALNMRSAIAIGCFMGLVACGNVGSNPATRVETGGAGDEPGTGMGGMAGMAPEATGGAGSAVETGGQAGAIVTQTGGAPGSGGSSGGSVGTGGAAAATGGTQGTGGAKALTACSYPGANWTMDGMYRGVSNGGTCRACVTDQECVTAYGVSNQCMGGSCALVGPWGPMPRQTCNSFNSTFAIGQATTTSAISNNPSDSSCVDQARSFVGNRPSIYLCKGIPTNYSGSVLSVTPNSQNGWSDADGNCNVTVVTQIPGSNGCQFEAIFSLLAQAPPKGDGPFSAPTCN